MSDEITRFLRARIAERDLFWEVSGETRQAHPDRVHQYRAEGDAMRRIVDLHRPSYDTPAGPEFGTVLRRLLACDRHGRSTDAPLSDDSAPRPALRRPPRLPRRVAAMTCPVCDGAGIVDTSPPGVEGRP